MTLVLLAAGPVGAGIALALRGRSSRAIALALMAFALGVSLRQPYQSDRLLELSTLVAPDTRLYVASALVTGLLVLAIRPGSRTSVADPLAILAILGSILAVMIRPPSPTSALLVMVTSALIAIGIVSANRHSGQFGSSFVALVSLGSVLLAAALSISLGGEVATHRAALALTVVGLALTTGVFPFGPWLAPIHLESSDDWPAPALLSLLVGGAAVWIVLAARTALLAGLDDPSTRLTLGVAGTLFGLVAAVSALGARQPARRLALLLGAASATTLAALADGSDVAAAAARLTFAALGPAFVLGCVGSSLIGRRSQISIWGWKARADLVGRVAVAMAGASLAGWPPLLGFVGRWPALLALANVGTVPLALGIATSVVGGIAALRGFGDEEGLSQQGDQDEVRSGVVVALCGAALIVVLFGLYPAPLVDLAR